MGSIEPPLWISTDLYRAFQQPPKPEASPEPEPPAPAPLPAEADVKVLGPEELLRIARELHAIDSAGLLSTTVEPDPSTATMLMPQLRRGLSTTAKDLQTPTLITLGSLNELSSGFRALCCARLLLTWQSGDRPTAKALSRLLDAGNALLRVATASPPPPSAPPADAGSLAPPLDPAAAPAAAPPAPADPEAFFLPLEEVRGLFTLHVDKPLDGDGVPTRRKRRPAESLYSTAPEPAAKRAKRKGWSGTGPRPGGGSGAAREVWRLAGRVQQRVAQMLEAVVLPPDDAAHTRTPMDGIRRTPAAEECRRLGIDFRETVLRLMAGEYAWFDEIYADVSDACIAAAEGYDLEACPGVRRGKLVGSAQQYYQLILDVLEKLEVQTVRLEKRRLASEAAEPLPPPDIMSEEYAPTKLPKCIEANREPYYHVDAWRREPYVPRPYERLDHYELSEEREVIDWKLMTEKRGGCGGEGCATHEDMGSFNFETMSFASKCSCLTRNTECDAHCACDASTCLNRAVGSRKPLQLGRDVVEIDTWGMDCYTRRNVLDAVLESEAFGPYARPAYEAPHHDAPAAANPLTTGEITHALPPSALPASSPSAAAAGAGGGGDGGDAADRNAGVEEKASQWVERTLLPAINYQGAHGWDMRLALEAVRARAKPLGDEASVKAADAVEARLQEVGYNFFRVHPKGTGLQCAREGGLAPLTLVEEYYGEMHTPWRWFEIQDVIKKLNKEDLPEFYNMTMERPRDDALGYDCLFIEAASKGSFCSRMSHSCSPNCQAVVMAADGRLTVAMYTLRRIAPGEELTFDYSAVTESEKEFHAATCLCASRHCRGSFLAFAGSRAFSVVLASHHNMLHRQAMLLQAASQELTGEDKARLERHGIKDSALGCAAVGGRVPAWLEKWAALVAEWVDMEAEVLPGELQQPRPPYPPLSAEIAKVEAAGVTMNRLSNVVITLDKIKYCLSKSPVQGPPLFFLPEQEALEHLWTGPRSIARRLLLAASPSLADGAAAKALAAASGGGGAAAMAAVVAAAAAAYPALKKVADVALQPAATLEEARAGLLALSRALREVDVAGGSGTHTAAADLMLMYGHTRRWFVAERGYRGFQSPPVPLSSVTVLTLDRGPPPGPAAPPLPPGGGAGMTAADREEADAAAALMGVAAGLGPAAEDGGGEGGARRPQRKPKEPRLPSGVDRAALQKKYGPLFIWGQLNGWYKQTVYDPTASLSAERRGTISLPDVESCYGGQRQYTLRDREAVIDHIAKRPDALWKTAWLWSFRNEAKVYGSPWFDATWAAQSGAGHDPMPELLQQLRTAPLPERRCAGGGGALAAGRPGKRKAYDAAVAGMADAVAVELGEGPEAAREGAGDDAGPGAHAGPAVGPEAAPDADA